MNSSTKKRLERAGWVVGDTAGFLQLSEAESRFLEMKLALASGERGAYAIRAGRPAGIESIPRGQDGSRGPLCFARPHDAVAAAHRRHGN